MDSAELTDWQAFERIEPWGFEVFEDWFALIACILANQWRGKGKPVSMETFKRTKKSQGKPVEEMTPEEMREEARRLCKALAGG